MTKNNNNTSKLVETTVKNAEGQEERGWRGYLTDQSGGAILPLESLHATEAQVMRRQAMSIHKINADKC